MKKLFIKTYGCQMNFYDSDHMSNLLKDSGYTVSEEVKEADLVILNTCHIRDKAAEKVYSDLGRIKKVYENNHLRKPIIAVTGCVAQAEGKEITKRSPWVDLVVGPQAYTDLPKLIEKIKHKPDHKEINLQFPEVPKFDLLNFESKKSKVSDFITIQEGCDKFCSFCVVPFTRGAEYSRSVQEIVNEAESLCQKGCKEIILLGQNVNAYHGINKNNKQINLAGLIKELVKIKKLERITYTTSHPRDMNDDLIDLHEDSEKLNPYLHLPVQSGSDDILKNMNRKYTSKQYLEIIDKLRKKVPNIALSSDFIVGFPGETEKDFQDTLNLVKEVKFAQSYSFKYSRRIGTKANRINCMLTEEEKNERLQVLQMVLNKQKHDYNKTFLGKRIEVFIKGKGKKDNQYKGTTKWMQSTIFESKKHLETNKVNLKIKSAMDNCLLGDLI